MITVDEQAIRVLEQLKLECCAKKTMSFCIDCDGSDCPILNTADEVREKGLYGIDD